jgi:hypothetical protein
MTKEVFDFIWVIGMSYNQGGHIGLYGKVLF